MKRNYNDLHICPHCGSGFVYPTSWDRVDKYSWEMDLRCPNCEHYEEGLVVAQYYCDLFDDELERQRIELVEAEKKFTQENMRSYHGRFATALQANAILPMDF